MNPIYIHSYVCIYIYIDVPIVAYVCIDILSSRHFLVKVKNTSPSRLPTIRTTRCFFTSPRHPGNLIFSQFLFQSPHNFDELFRKFTLMDYFTILFQIWSDPFLQIRLQNILSCYFWGYTSKLHISLTPQMKSIKKNVKNAAPSLPKDFFAKDEDDEDDLPEAQVERPGSASPKSHLLASIVWKKYPSCEFFPLEIFVGMPYIHIYIYICILYNYIYITYRF